MGGIRLRVPLTRGTGSDPRSKSKQVDCGKQKKKKSNSTEMELPDLGGNARWTIKYLYRMDGLSKIQRMVLALESNVDHLRMADIIKWNYSKKNTLHIVEFTIRKIVDDVVRQRDLEKLNSKAQVFATKLQQEAMKAIKTTVHL